MKAVPDPTDVDALRPLPLRVTDTSRSAQRGLWLIAVGCLELCVLAVLAFLHEQGGLDVTRCTPAVWQSALLLAFLGAFVGIVVGVTQRLGWFTLAFAGVGALGGALAGGILAALLHAAIAPILDALQGGG